MVKWDDVQGDFEPDGALRDIYVMDVTPVGWNRVLELLVKTGTARYSVDDVEAPLPSEAAEALEQFPDRSPLLVADVEGIQYGCHFFDPNRVELDFWPEDVGGPEEFAALVRFVTGLGRATERPVLVTYEGSEAAEIFRYVPESDATEAGPVAGRRAGR